MKKMWLAIMLALALVCWGGSAMAEECEHYTSCIGSGTCYFCGADGWFAPIHAHVNIMNVGRGHLVECTDCGVIVEQGPHTYVDGECDVCDALQSECPHYVFCDKPTVCLDCGAEDVQKYEQVGHRGKNTYVDIGDDEKHSVRCGGCGAELKTQYHNIEFKSINKAEHCVYCIECGGEYQYQPHQARCTDAFCNECGETDLDSWCIYHGSWDDNQYIDLGDTHRAICKECGDTISEGKHQAMCNKPNECYECGAEIAVSADRIAHSVEVYIEGDQCGSKCIYCGHVDLFNHDFSCVTNECRSCGTKAEDKNMVSHIYWEGTPRPVNEKKHGFECADCRAYVEEDHWFYEDACFMCGFERPASLPGDADNNSSVTIDDAIAILSGSVSSESNADVNGDGNVDQQDVLRIMQYLAGWGVTLQ